MKAVWWHFSCGNISVAHRNFWEAKHIAMFLFKELAKQYHMHLGEFTDVKVFAYTEDALHPNRVEELLR